MIFILVHICLCFFSYVKSYLREKMVYSGSQLQFQPIIVVKKLRHQEIEAADDSHCIHNPKGDKDECIPMLSSLYPILYSL